MNATDGVADTRPAIPPAAPDSFEPAFQVILHGSTSTGTSLAICCLWAVAMIGGVGARTRRGFGSLAFTPDGEPTYSLADDLDLKFWYPGTLEEIAAGYRDGLQAALNAIASACASITPAPPGNPDSRPQGQSDHDSSRGFPAAPPSAIPSLTTGSARLLLVQNTKGYWPTWDEAMKDLREKFYRPYKNDHSVGTNTGPYYKTDTGWLRKYEVGSPSWLHIQIKTAEPNGYYGVILAFRTAQDPGWTKLLTRLSESSLYFSEVNLPTPHAAHPMTADH